MRKSARHILDYMRPGFQQKWCTNIYANTKTYTNKHAQNFFFFVLSFNHSTKWDEKKIEWISSLPIIIGCSLPFSRTTKQSTHRSKIYHHTVVIWYLLEIETPNFHITNFWQTQICNKYSIKWKHAPTNEEAGEEKEREHDMR